MRVELAFVISLVAAAPASAYHGVDSCRVERQDFAKAACLELVFDQEILRMTQDISDLLARLQAATAAELLSLQRQYDSAQAKWQQELRQACSIRHARDAVAFQTCRIGALAARAEQVALSLERAAEDFGAPVEYQVPIPESVEILIPLPVPIPFGGEARLPLLIPIHPE